MEQQQKQQKQRSQAQNRFLHSSCAEIARELNEKGVSVTDLVREMEADVSPELVKEMWRAYARVKFGKTSTADLTTKEFSDILEEMNRHLSQFGIHIDLPGDENLLSYYDDVV